MPKPYPEDLYKRLDREYAGCGGSATFKRMMKELEHLSVVTRDEAIGKQFNVSPLTVHRWRRRLEGRGN